MKGQHPTNLTAFSVTWVNGTTAQIQTAFTSPVQRLDTSATSATYSENDTVIKFSSVDEATKYVNNQATGYYLMSTDLNSLNNSSFQFYYRFVLAHQQAKLAEGYTPSVHALYGGSNGTIVSGSRSYGWYAEQNAEYLWLVNYQMSW